MLSGKQAPHKGGRHEWRPYGDDRNRESAFLPRRSPSERAAC